MIFSVIEDSVQRNELEEYNKNCFFSPDFNPIEKMWSKIKSISRKIKIRIIDSLHDAIINAFSTICASDCSGWFAFCYIG